MDDGRLIQENAGLVGAIIGFVASQLVQVWRDGQAEKRAINTELRADKRAQRDATLARMRAAFQPVLLSAWGYQTAGVDVRHSSKSSTMEARQELLSDAMKGLNEARAQLAVRPVARLYACAASVSCRIRCRLAMPSPLSG